MVAQSSGRARQQGAKTNSGQLKSQESVKGQETTKRKPQQLTPQADAAVKENQREKTHHRARKQSWENDSAVQRESPKTNTQRSRSGSKKRVSEAPSETKRKENSSNVGTVISRGLSTGCSKTAHVSQGSDEDLDFSAIEQKIFEGVQEECATQGKRRTAKETSGIDKIRKNTAVRPHASRDHSVEVDKSTRSKSKSIERRVSDPESSKQRGNTHVLQDSGKNKRHTATPREKLDKKESGTSSSMRKGREIKARISGKDTKSLYARKRGNKSVVRDSGSQPKDIQARRRERKDATKDSGKLSTPARRIKVESKGSGGKRSQKPGQVRSQHKAAASESELSDWEEVDEMEGVDEVKELLSQTQSTEVKPEGVQIELDAPDVMWGMRKRKRRTEEEMIEDYLRKKVNRSIREVYENMHKVHLLCLLAWGQRLNHSLNTDTLLGAALSIINNKNVYPPKRLNLDHLQQLVNWFVKKMHVVSVALEEDYWSKPLGETLAKRFEVKAVRSSLELVLAFVVVCRALGITARLVLSLQPLSWKPSAELLVKPPKKEGKEGPSCSQEVCTVKADKGEQKPNRKMLSSESEVSPASTKDRGMKKVKNTKPPKRKSTGSSDEWDSDFKPSKIKFKSFSKPVQHRRGSGKRKSMEGDDGDGGGKGKEAESKKRKASYLTEWAEIYVEEEEKWICVDIIKTKIHCIPQIQARLTPGSAYITAFNSNLSVKDVTRRYITSWLSSEKKIRCCSKWWEESMRPFQGVKTRIDEEEDKEMNQILQLQPLPKSIAEYKNHPLYALQRHLLKFEAIYPPDVSPVGFIKGQPVYPRSSIYNLHSRDTWMKEAKSVRVGEEPYKVVKARPKWDRNTCQVIKDRPLEVFGEWQVEDYEPPVASGGKVPRNEYGNVELFKPSMLPRGCVHIPVSGLNRVARKLNIDCAPAMVGFDFHSGWTHPVYDGYVVCQEFKDVLMDAWNQEQEEQARRAEEKRQKRIYNNWRKLIQGVLVRERVRQNYSSSSSDQDDREDQNPKDEKTKKKAAKGGTRRKVKQDDIDSMRPEGESSTSQNPDAPPPLITHQVKSLSIDLSSNVVEMAKRSRQKTMKTKNTAKRVTVPPKQKQLKGKGLSDGDSGEETDEDVKKEKIRAILQWGDKAQMSDPDLSDDSDGGASRSRPADPFIGFSPSPSAEKAKSLARKSKKRTSEVESGCSSSESESLTSHSTTPEPDPTPQREAPRRLSRRVAKKRVETYEESGGESEGDISLDESDCEDKSYQPLKD